MDARSTDQVAVTTLERGLSSNVGPFAEMMIMLTILITDYFFQEFSDTIRNNGGTSHSF